MYFKVILTATLHLIYGDTDQKGGEDEFCIFTYWLVLFDQQYDPNTSSFMLRRNYNSSKLAITMGDIYKNINREMVQ